MRPPKLTKLLPAAPVAWAGELPEADAAPDVAEARAEEALEAMPVPDGTVELTPGTIGALSVGTGATGVLPEGTTGAGVELVLLVFSTRG
jgi:hypothetical protein